MPWETDFLTAFDADSMQKYVRDGCAVFRKTKELWGEYSNMAAGFPLTVNGIHIRTSEALYQACKYPHMPEVQQRIIEKRSPMGAKMTQKRHKNEKRPDWKSVWVPVMWWSLRVKLACNIKEFGRILRASDSKQIVEDSHKDKFWGAVALRDDPQMLEGKNVLGRLLVLLRDSLRERGEDAMLVVEPLAIDDFLLYGEQIRTVHGNK